MTLQQKEKLLSYYSIILDELAYADKTRSSFLMDLARGKHTGFIVACDLIGFDIVMAWSDR